MTFEKHGALRAWETLNRGKIRSKEGNSLQRTILLGEGQKCLEGGRGID